MTQGLGFFVVATEYPELPPDQLQDPACELHAAWDHNAVWELVSSADDLPLLRKVWTPKPTMIHPTHVVALADEFADVLARIPTLDAQARDEIDQLRTVLSETAAAGRWIVSIGP